MFYIKRYELKVYFIFSSKKYKPLKISWLKEDINKKYKQMKFQRNRQILIETIRWIFQDIIIPIIRSNFYVTEKHNEGSKIFYYRLFHMNLSNIFFFTK